ncbi:YgaP family membrane protein [Varunaivibrio sulfuroxidans]|uniref:DUF2892 family protein n=1 Tax=Varunaivibrio sulfuroxidans TaxID=1773489 RepID=A0A4R3JBN4_9PROT|nr:DUF2892 domain-containing protein [Varunaivibrio sulfuroxidans]TCS63122.1 DUF2892 family protein [Varunaivibrio sulfuroxidans]WES31808.1 DUF2892 domain-containing protein [Varunaivibrio sulfuroxidans]
MKKNVGGADRIIRIILGLAILSLFFILEGNARYWALVGLIPLGTALIGWCPPYAIFGMNTCRTKNDTPPD